MGARPLEPRVCLTVAVRASLEQPRGPWPSEGQHSWPVTQDGRAESTAEV